MEPGESLDLADADLVSDGYFEAMKIPLVQGRVLRRARHGRGAADHHRRRAPGAEVLAWPGSARPADVSARTVQRTSSSHAGDEVHDGGRRRRRSADGRSGARPQAGRRVLHSLCAGAVAASTLVVRTALDPDAFINQVRKQIAAIDPELPLYSIDTMEARLDEGFVGRQVPMLVAAAFGVVALLLAALGIYGVLAYGVAQRRREIGIRMALGSTTREVFGLVLRRRDQDRRRSASSPGAVMAYFVGRAMQTQLYEVRATDPTVAGLVVALLVVVALIATLVPARRAAKVNPAGVLGALSRVPGFSELRFMSRRSGLPRHRTSEPRTYGTPEPVNRRFCSSVSPPSPRHPRVTSSARTPRRP